MGWFFGIVYLGDKKFFQDILFKRQEEVGELMAARDREREWGLSEVPAATVGEGGGNPQKDKDVPQGLYAKRETRHAL